MDNLHEGAAPAALGRRWPELLMAGFLAGLAALVIGDSLRVGIDWASDGPRAGYFPFYIGLLLLVASASIAAGQLRRWAASRQVFATRAELASVATLALPMLVFGIALKWVGIYLCSAALIGWFMVRHGRHPLPATIAVAAGVPLALWVTFERWFMVPLPKGVLQNLLGI